MVRRIKRIKGTTFGMLLPSGRVINKQVIDLSTIKSSDPLAFAFGKTQAIAGRPFPKEKGLAPEFVRGFKIGRKLRKKRR